MSPPDVLSLIVPAYNEERYLPALLASLRAARGRGAPRGGIEVVVADNGSTDDTVAVAESEGVTVVHESRRRIGAVRNAGARAARGDVLVFADADFELHPGTFHAIDAALEDRAVLGGSTGFRHERRGIGMAATTAVIALATWMSGHAGGVVFCRRELFDAVGGFREEDLYAEDVRFLLDVGRAARASGGRTVRLRGVTALASARKFDAYGEWHYLRNLLRSGYWALRDPEAQRAWAERYWYDQR